MLVQLLHYPDEVQAGALSFHTAKTEGDICPLPSFGFGLKKYSSKSPCTPMSSLPYAAGKCHQWKTLIHQFENSIWYSCLPSILTHIQHCGVRSCPTQNTRQLLSYVCVCLCLCVCVCVCTICIFWACVCVTVWHVSTAIKTKMCQQ